MVDLRSVTDEHLSTARSSAHGRSAHLLVHDGHLRQTLIALRAGEGLSEHNPPQAGSVHVLVGRVRITAGDRESEVGAGELVELVHERHSVTAVEDSVFLLTTVTGLPDGDPTV
ncbi:cupin domain-containing protein [Kineococcus auxinigenes]|uniref:cupin domain-containing protein n=1 Tax=unclassified Kineococcus TaxID=2621656 RepID=UPI003D7E5550